MDLERNWKRRAKAYFQILSRNILVGIEENHENLSTTILQANI
jgi:hypothetical protein